LFAKFSPSKENVSDCFREEKEPVTYSSWKAIETSFVFSFQHHTFSSCDIPTLINNSEWEVNQLPLTGKWTKECDVLNAGSISDDASYRCSLYGGKFSGRW
jgi:hypothetical protein